MKYKLKAKQSFVDKYTEQVYKVDEMIKATEERGKELLADPRELVELVEEIKEEEPEEEKPAKKTTTRKKKTGTAE